MTCSSWPGSALTPPQSGATATRIATSSPRRRRSSFSSSRMRSFSRSTWGDTTCWRLNVSNCRVSTAAREATNRLHLLRLAELLFEPLALRHIIDHDLLGPPAGERDSVTAGLHLDERPVLLAMPPGAGVVVVAGHGFEVSM